MDPTFDPGEPERYRKDVPSAQVYVLDAGHLALDTKADEIAALVREFLKTQKYEFAANQSSPPSTSCARDLRKTELEILNVVGKNRFYDLPLQDEKPLSGPTSNTNPRSTGKARLSSLIHACCFTYSDLMVRPSRRI
jgi:hypothetical protein